MKNPKFKPKVFIQNAVIYVKNKSLIIVKIIILFLITLLINQSIAAPTRYGEQLCQQNGYHCIRVTHQDSWDELFPSIEQQDLVKRVNRMNIELKPGMVIAVPDNLENISIYDVSPFPRYIEATNEKTIYVNQEQLAWAAYDEQGELVWWGPLSSGSGKCASEGHCQTPSGEFRIIRKQDYDCTSTAFSQNTDGFESGAPMPYCMHFYRGYALHGSDVVPGYRASHGCVRMFIEDARWLNEEFIDLPGAGGFIGTRVIIEAP